MKKITLICFLVSNACCAQMSLIGFHDLNEGTKSEKVFLEYLKLASPIMKKYAINLQLFKVLNSSKNSISADYITVSSVDDKNDVSRYQDDESHIKLKETLKDAIVDYHVIYSPARMNAFPVDKTEVLFNMMWLKTDNSDTWIKYNDLKNELSRNYKDFEVSVLLDSIPTAAYEGLDRKIKSSDYPHEISFYHFKNPDRYFSDQAIQKTSREMLPLIKKGMSYWMVVHDFDDK